MSRPCTIGRPLICHLSLQFMLLLLQLLDFAQSLLIRQLFTFFSLVVLESKCYSRIDWGSILYSSNSPESSSIDFANLRFQIAISSPLPSTGLYHVDLSKLLCTCRAAISFPSDRSMLSYRTIVTRSERENDIFQRIFGCILTSIDFSNRAPAPIHWFWIL